MSTNDSVEKQVASLHKNNGLPHANQLKTLQDNLGPGYNRDDSHELNTKCDSSIQMPPQNSSQPNSAVAGSTHVNFSHSEQLNLSLKKEPSDAGQKNIGEPLRFEVNSADNRSPADGLVTEEPLEIQCGENNALLYVSKLCQGSKGPCILFQGEWLTPNELQYISGRETAKDWKRSIRYKGKSLKSLIARGLIKVHPPICDCLGCRISSPVNRGRLDSKCSVSSPSSPTRKRKESVKQPWRQDGFGTGLAFASARQNSSSELDNCIGPSVVRTGVDQRASPADSTSSTASECSEPADDCPFDPPSSEPKRSRSSSPENVAKLVTMKRRATDSRFQFDPRSTFFFKDFPSEYTSASGTEVSKLARKDLASLDLANHHRPHETGGSSGGPQGNRSAFRAVHQDALNSHNEKAAENVYNAEALQREPASRETKISKQHQKPPSVNCHPASFNPFPQLPSPSSLISPSHPSPRLIPDHLLLTSPHGSSIYHQALRGGLSGVPSAALHQSLLHYRLLSPPNPHGSPLAQNIPLQSPFAAAARAGLQGFPLSMHRTSSSSSPKNNTIINGQVDENKNLTGARTMHVEEEKHEEKDCDRTKDTESHNSNDAFHPPVSDGDYVPGRSPDVSAGSNERQSPFATPKASPNGKDHPLRVSPHKLVPRFRPNLNENVLEWSVDDVCQFISSLTGSQEIALAFREEQIDGHSLVLVQEDHLLNRMSIRLGPALKIAAQIKKLAETLETQENGLN